MALLELRGAPGDLVKLEDLAVPFARHVREHLAIAPKQATSQSSRFLEACRKANKGELSDEALRDTTVALGFNNVIDAFHRLGPSDTPVRFSIDERPSHRGIRLTDQLRSLGESAHPDDLVQETEARWRLVETAWELGISHSLIKFDRSSENLTAEGRDRRIAVTSCRSALNGYQKGHCFYCYAPIAISAAAIDADVDHFFPWAVRALIPGNVNGVWNLVLACRACNRGARGKFDQVPTRELLERLHARNEFLITSHHPLREIAAVQSKSLHQASSLFHQTHEPAVPLQPSSSDADVDRSQEPLNPPGTIDYRQ